MVYALRDRDNKAYSYYSSTHQLLGRCIASYSGFEKIFLGSRETPVVSFPEREMFASDHKVSESYGAALNTLDEEVRGRLSSMPSLALAGYDLLAVSLRNNIISAASIIDCLRPYGSAQNHRGPKPGTEEIDDYSDITEKTLEELFDGNAPDIEARVAKMADDTGADKSEFFLMFALAGARAVAVYEDNDLFNDATDWLSSGFSMFLDTAQQTAERELTRNGRLSAAGEAKKSELVRSIADLKTKFAEAARETYKPFTPDYLRQASRFANLEVLVDAALRHHNPEGSYDENLTGLKYDLGLIQQALRGAELCYQDALAREAPAPTPAPAKPAP